MNGFTKNMKSHNYMKTCFGWATEPFSFTVIVAESSFASAIAKTMPSFD